MAETGRVDEMRRRACAGHDLSSAGRAVTARVRDLPGVVAVEADPVTGRLVAYGDVTRSQVLAALLGPRPPTPVTDAAGESPA